MYEILKIVHSWWAYFVLLALLCAVLNAAWGFFSRRDYKQSDYRIGLFALISIHIQLLMGIILYFVTPLLASWNILGAKIMKDATLRKVLVEHPFGMIVGVILITIGWSLHKKQKTSKGAFGRLLLFYLLGGILMLGVIRWDMWPNF